MRVRKARHQAGLSQQVLAERMGVTRGAVANWESAVAVPAARRLARIANVTGVSYEWLATGRGAMLPELGFEDPKTPAIDADFVDDPVERQLLDTFRMASMRARKAALDTLKASARRLAP
ncbi:MAG: helix-turn-helix transcriptional regulator [Pseudoxanthomonas sp.]|nr:helix-turn-helix transcriptional regulator [Pseudoxanthomonas sp.]MBP8742386.1 helix-turn-helix transcriptional regulator [Pseudoxanthomonas sp.]MBP8908197.1 helix-turn-helix transcriptional regulator [Pseudoxanthomonas sp.]MBP9644801.1 helix-turn-helix transcriptional regulator [Pseudoxanthomonas sp.]